MVKWMLAIVIALCGSVVFAENPAGGAAGQQPAAADQGQKKDDVKMEKKEKKAGKKAKKARKGKKAEEKKGEAAPAAPAQK